MRQWRATAIRRLKSIRASRKLQARDGARYGSVTTRGTSRVRCVLLEPEGAGIYELRGVEFNIADPECDIVSDRQSRCRHVKKGVGPSDGAWVDTVRSGLDC